MKILLCVALSMVFASSAAAEVFVYEWAGRQFEAEVTPERLTLKEKRDSGAANATSLDCPLGSAVRANVVPAGPSSTKVCLVFSRQQCTYGDGQRAGGTRAAGGAFRCIEFGEAQQAGALAALINAGPQPEAGQEPVAPAPAAGRPAAKAAPARAATEPGAPAVSPSVSGRSPQPANAASTPKSSTSVRKPNGASGSAAGKSVVTDEAARPARKPAAASPQPAAVDRSNGEGRPNDKRGRVEGAERSAQAVTPGERGVRPKFGRPHPVQSG